MSLLRRGFRTVGLPVVALVLCAWLLVARFGGGGHLAPRPAQASLREVEIVVASLKSENTSWVQQYLPDWSHSIYVVDDPAAKLTVAKNKGREAMVYLTHIIDRYDSLAPITVFAHAARFAWHNDDPDYDALATLHNLQLDYVRSSGYVNLRCVWVLGCPGEIRPKLDALDEPYENAMRNLDPKHPPATKQVYKQSFQELLPGEDMPELVGVSCCSQFAVSWETIRRRPRGDYVRWRDWLLNTELIDDLSGRVLEYTWHIMFGKEGVYCPNPSAQSFICSLHLAELPLHVRLLMRTIIRLASWSQGRLLNQPVLRRRILLNARIFSTTSTMAEEYKLKGVTSLTLQPGDKVEVDVEGLDAKVLLVNAAGKVQAVGPKCTHYGAPLVKGVLGHNGKLTCPWHGACFNTKTGDIEDGPALDPLPVFKTIERDGAVYITGDADTIKAGRRKPNFKCTSIGADKVLVVGGGSGALGVVEGLRNGGYAGAITVVSNEGYLPIDRPKLSKALLTDLSKLQWRDAEWYKSGSVDIVQDEVVDVDFAAKTVSTKSGGKFAYTKLVLSTGGTPRLLPLQGFKVLGNIFTLRNVGDAGKINEAIGDKGKKIVIIGSSFIGMEIAVATSGGNDVTVVGMEKAPLERVLGETVGNFIKKGVESKGVKFYLSAGVEKAEPSASDPSKVGSVWLKDGTKLDADIVILGVGVAPATEYLRNNSVVRLEGDGSLKTDESFSVVGLKDVYAIGDIATYPYHGPGGGGRYVRIEHWNVAQNAGRTVAAHITNPNVKPEFFTPVFWSALGAQLRYCGNTIASGWDDVVLQGTPDEGKWVAYYTKDDTVVAMASMGMDPVMAQCAQLMQLNKMPSKKQIQGGLDVLSLGAPQ
ncbi:hypothetical protein OQA88_7079 [Cercophora sp. LCS_1]